MVLLATPGARAQDGRTPAVAVSGRASVYQDDDRTTVITFVTEASGTVRDLTLRAGFLADVQTSASVDVVTNATPGTKPEYSEPRTEFSVDTAYRLDPFTVSAAYIFSNEHDYRSHTLSVGASLDLFRRNSTVALAYGLGLNQIWRGGVQNFTDGRASTGHVGAGPDPFFEPRDKTRHGLDLSWTQVLDQRTLGAVSYGLALESGFLSSPYRFVSSSDGAFRTREVHPDLRVRNAVGFRVRRYLFDDTALEGTYRFYGDDWEVFSSFRNFILYGGGQVYASGKRGSRPWRVGIRDPRKPAGHWFAVLELFDASLSTSGDYEHFFIVDGVRYHHILDLRTGFPARSCRSVTVLAPDGTMADALSTAAFVLGAKRGLRLLRQFPGAEGLVVDDQNRVHISEGLREKIVVRSPTP